MKLILLSFLRRWWIRYAVAGILVLAVDVTAQLVPDLQRAWTPYLFAPWLGGFLVTMDLVSGTAPLSLLLPISARKVGLCYWLLGVGIPTISLGLLQWIGGLILIALGLGVMPEWSTLLQTMFIAFLLAGVSFFTSTLLPTARGEPESFSSALVFHTEVSGIVLIWLASMMSGFGLPQVLAWFRRGEAGVSLTIAGVVLTALGFSRATSMLLRRVRNRPVESSPQEPNRALRTSGGFGRSGLPALFTDTLPLSIQMALISLLMTAVFSFLRVSPMFLYFLCFFVSVMAPMRYVLSMRALRVLPISTNRFALVLCLVPVVNSATFLGVVAIGLAIMGGSKNVLAGAPASQLMLVGGVACFSSVMCVRFGPKAMAGLGIVGVWTMMAFAYFATRFNFPMWVIFALGLGFLGFSFALARRWVGTGGTYRSRVDAVAVL